MSEFYSSSGPLPPIPDALTIPQFMLDTQHSSRPFRPEGVPWLVEDHSGRGIVFKDLHTRTHGLANALKIKWNICENDVVCIFSPNHVDYPVAIWAVFRLGGIITPANPSYTADELVHQLTTTKAALILVHPDFLTTALSAARAADISTDRIALFDRLPDSSPVAHQTTLNDLIAIGSANEPNYIERQLNPGEAKTKLAFLSFSSGTTGKPKAVAISHYSVISNVIQMATHYKINDPTWKEKVLLPGDVAIAVLPFFHIYGLVVNMHFMLFCGLSLVVIPKFNFVEFLKSIVRFRITHLFLVPPQIVLLCKHPIVKEYDFSHVKFCLCGAAPLSGELTQQAIKLFPHASIGQGYGLTETCTSISMIPPTQKIGTIGSAGQLIPGVVARVVKPDGSLARRGEQGELVVTGPSMALGYANNAQATKDTFVDGWVRTGDEVKISDNNEIFVVDRVKEIFKVRGYQVAPAELEGHLLTHPDVADTCVVSIPDEYSGELPLAYVVLDAKSAERIARNPSEAAKIKAALIKHVANAKVPYKWLAGGVEFIDAIPKNPSGKMLRRILRDKARALRAKDPAQAKL